MKAIYLTLMIVLLFIYPIYSQDLNLVDKKVDAYPKSFSKPEKLAELINTDFKTDIEKARAIYSWIAKNVKYDVGEYFSGGKVVSYSYSSQEEKERKEKELEQKMAVETMKKKKAVCQGYSGLYKLLCDLTGLECVVISGYSKIMDRDIGKTPKQSDHAWNAVKINNKWELLDVTWGAGSVDYSRKVFIAKYSDAWFMSKPEKFFLKHFPENKDWLFVKKTLDDFVELPLYYSDISLLDIEVIKPQKGILGVKANDKLEFKWKTNLETKDISYAFKGDKYGKEIQASSKDGILTFEILVEKTGAEFLTFYYKGSAILTYELQKK